MLTKRYMTSVKNLSKIMEKIVEGTAPKKFTISHLKSIGFTSSNDVGVIGLLKDLGFLSQDGTPTQRYHDYRDKSRSKTVMADALREAYEDLFHINEKPTSADRAAIEGKFKSVHNATDRIASEQAKTFEALLKLADLDGAKPSTKKKDSETKEPERAPSAPSHVDASTRAQASFVGLRYNVEVHLPATKDVEVFNAIFKALKEHLLDD
jgi:hypothetical protein